MSIWRSAVGAAFSTTVVVFPADTPRVWPAAATVTTPSVVAMSVTFPWTLTWNAVPWTVALEPGVSTS